jgi:hypothetical protein
MARTRDPAGLGEVTAHCAAHPVGETTTQRNVATTMSIMPTEASVAPISSALA